MDSESVVPFLHNKTILVIGATGFLGKIFVEKILRVQPKVKKLYLLIRAHDYESATRRFDDEIIGKELFKVLKEKWGTNFNSFIAEKVIVVAGDISHQDLGLKDSNLEQQLWREIDIVVNQAATTNFMDRYDVSLGLNTFGAKNVLDFAKKCVKLKMFVHVSTAYVSGERSGLILESSYSMGETVNGVSGLDINNEMEVTEKKMKQLQANGASTEEITQVMKDLGIERARYFGWPNTYAFTKAMGEMLLGKFKGDLPLVILRPTIVTSTLKEPFPGWIEGLRTVDSVILPYARGKVTSFPGNSKLAIDLIPADMVINALIVAMTARANQSSPEIFIYHVGSSVKNPITATKPFRFFYQYFSKNPYTGRDGRAIRVRKIFAISSMAKFRLYMKLRYVLPLKGFHLVNKVCFQHFKEDYYILDRKVKSGLRLAELYRPYIFFHGIFDDKNLEKLRMEMAANESRTDLQEFNFDPTCIDWEYYFINIHIPGLMKHVIKY